MGALANAASLMKDGDFRELMMAGSVYQARLVITEAGTAVDHDTRLKLANTVVMDPRMFLDRFINVIACDPNVANLGAAAAAIPENTITSKVAEVWTPLAKLLFPPVV